MKFKFNFFLVFVIFAILFAGCSKEDCSLKDTTYKKYSYDEDTKSCVISKTIKENVCGNLILEDKETFCNCPKDVPESHPTLGCTGTLGTYLEKSCSVEKKCVLTQNVKVVEQSKIIQFQNSDLTLTTNFLLNMPYIQNTIDENKVQIDLKLLKVATANVNIKDIYVEELTIEDAGAILLATATYNENIDMSNPELTKKTISLSDISKYEKKETLKLKLSVKYTKESLDYAGEVIKTENKIETIASTLGTWTIINPNLFDPKLNK